MYPIPNLIVDYLNKLRDYGLEYVAKRFYSKYSGKVESNTDPQQQGRVKVSVPALGYLLGNDAASTAQTLPKYAYPSSPYAGNNHGFYFPPEVGDPVWVWFDHGHPTQPNISGGWWFNTGEGNPKSAALSQIPVEFNSVANATLDNNTATVNPLTPSVTTRGIKTKGGHGLLFEDDPATGPTREGRETRVELWSGEQPLGLVPAIKHHRIVLSDFLKKIMFKSFLGHKTEYSDDPATQGITTTSIYGHTFKLDDKSRQILLQTKLGHQFLIDDNANTILLKTTGGNTVTMTDPGVITLQTPAKQIISMTDAGPAPTISVNTPGNVAVQATTVTANATGAATVNAGAAATVSAQGLLTLSGQGIVFASTGTAASKMTAGGVLDSDFIGLVSEKYEGGLAQEVVGPWSMTPAVGTINSTNIQLGAAATKFVLVDSRFLLNVFNSHSHGAPGSPPTQQIGSSPGQIPLPTVATTHVKAS